MPNWEVIDLGRRDWAETWLKQRELVEQRKAGLVPDTLLFVEHPPVITLGRNSDERHILAPLAQLERLGIAVHETNRGGDVTFHGPGQIVGYPIFDLTGWKKDVRAYVRGLEQAIVGTLDDFGISAHTRDGKETGVYVADPGGGLPRKICALGVHISRWVTSHGFALNVSTDLEYFRYIVPCGLSLPVTSMAELGVAAGREEVMRAIVRHMAGIFGHELPIQFQSEPELQETLR